MCSSCPSSRKRKSTLHWDGRLSCDLPSLSPPSPHPVTHICWLGFGQQPGLQETIGCGPLLEGMAGLARSTYELRALLAFCVRTQQSGATITKHREAMVVGFSPNLSSFPRGLIPRVHSSASQEDVWGQMTKFWPRACGGSNKLPLPGLAQENLLHEPSFSPSRSAHLTSAPRRTWSAGIEDAAPPSTP